MSEHVPRGAKKLSPGVYSHRGEMHIDAVELCEAIGVEPSEENQEAVARAAVEQFAGPVDVQEHER